MKVLFFSLVFIFSISLLHGQSLETFEIEMNGEKSEITQTIESQWTGLYIQTRGKKRWQLTIAAENATYLEQIVENPRESKFDWDLTQTQAITWGVLTKDGQIYYEKIDEYIDGQMLSYDAMVFIYKSENDEKPHRQHLYEKDGQIYLGGAEKVQAQVSND
ncbi:MAG: hypothetical protein GY810_32460 [Aureispira sp.]|nr:hypothetical protein [Aureispira sp.]